MSVSPYRLPTPDAAQLSLDDPGSGPISLAFRGAIEDPQPGRFLDPLLEDVHAAALGGHRAVVIDFRALEFLNSSGIKALIKWVMRQVGPGMQERYPIRFRYDPGVTWQTTSLGAIARLSRGAVELDPVEDDRPRGR